MSTFKNIQGKNIRSYANNAPNATAGEMWYNQSELKLKGVEALSAWSSAAPLATAREKLGGAGTQQAAIAFGGNTPPTTTATEEYNGSGWSTGGTLNTSRARLGGAGTQTATLAFGGGPPSNGLSATEEYNGSAWTTQPNSMGNARYTTGTGSQTAGLALAGYSGSTPGPSASATEEYDGSSWTSTGTLNTARNYLAGFGIQTAAVGATGGPAGKVNVEEYDGSSWTTVNSVSNAREIAMSSGVQTNGIVYGGRVDPGSTSMNKTEGYDGTSWTALPTMGTARFGSGANQSSGTASAAIAAGGNINPPNSPVGTTEEYNVSANVITAGAFASGTNLPVARGQGGGCGTQTAALQCGGIADSPTSNTTTSFEYNGNAWAASPGSLNAATRNNSNFGIQTAAVTVGSLGPVTAAVDVYNGSSWTSGTSYPSPVSNIGAAGTNTAGLAWGGDQDPGYLTTTNEYNGSWTGGGAIPAARSNSACAGTQTAGLSVGGYVGSAAPSASVVASSLEYNGSSWTAGGTDLVARYNAGAAGIQTSALIFGGNTPSNTAQATLYDGTSFSTQPSMGTARFLQTQGLGATSTVALAAAGQSTTRLATVEEFTGETTAANIVDITTS